MRPGATAAARHVGVAAALIAATAGLAGCAGERPTLLPAAPRLAPAQARQLIDRAVPRSVADAAGWSNDLYAGFMSLGVAPTPEGVCAVVAVIEQESGFRVDPVIAGLASIAWREIDERAAHAGVPRVLVHSVLQLSSSNGRTYAERIDAARTEKQLSDIYEDFIAAAPMGKALFADRNPIRTRGPMQVQVQFAEHFAAEHPYPYPVKVSIAEELFTRRGGLYFGIAHLLAYAAPYDRYLYRFADFNAGQYASRNAAFQRAVSIASGIEVTADGALLPHEASADLGATERAVRSMARLDLSADVVHAALELGKTPRFAETTLYVRAFDLAEQTQRSRPPPARVPSIELRGPKISRRLTTAWYAERVEGRFERCLRR